MRRSFSLSTLLLLVAIAAVSLASIRSALSRSWVDRLSAAAAAPGTADAVIALIIAGAVVGALMGLGLTFWNRGGLLSFLGCIPGGMLLGAAAGAQWSVRVDWWVIFTVPIVLTSTVMVVALNRRRQFLARSATLER